MPFIATGKFLPNRMVFFFRQALEETIGRIAVDQIWRGTGAPDGCFPPVTDDLEKSVDFSSYSALCDAIGKVYGEMGARAILHHCGRAVLVRTLRSTAAIVALDGPRLHAQSGSALITEGMQSVTRLLGMLSDMECSMEGIPQGYRFHVSACPECALRTCDGCLCHSVAGMLRGALNWFGINPALPVREEECIACGAAGCVFSITGAF